MEDKKSYSKTSEELFDELKSSMNGLSSKEANNRIKKYGLNELPKKKKDSIFKLFFKALIDPIILLLIVAIISSLIVDEVVDALAIGFIILVDLVMEIYQENKALKTAESLSSLVKEKVKVMRDNKEVLIDSSLITVGDIIFLESGDKVSCDARIIKSQNFTVDESILTGESLSVEKNSKVINSENLSINDQKNMVFAGCSVVTGRASAIVIKTGLNTEIGNIANTLNETKEEKSPLTIRIDEFSKQITILLIIIAIIIGLILYFKGMEFNEILLSVIALAVSAMPEGLPLAMTMALTIGSNKMAREKVVAKKLNAVESLGSCTVIASDKTGTLTVNEQTAKKIVLPNDNEYEISGTGYNFEGEVTGKNLKYASEIATLGLINNEAVMDDENQFGDSIDMAFIVLAQKMKINPDNIEIIDKIPYESQNKYSAVFYKIKDETYCTIKGSVETVLKFCNKISFLDKFDKDKIELQNENLAKDGYRVIAVANGKIDESDSYKEKNIKDLEFKGLVGFIDPIREDAKDAIKKCREAGIKVMMITGDHTLTAYKIAKDLNLVNSYDYVTTGEEVESYLNKTELEFDEFIKSKLIYSRVTPMQKLKIVESLKRQGEFVAVTGDGVNDAPALKTANIGVAMGSGTDIAKESADMIIMDDNFKSIVKGVLEGRVAYSNIRKITYFLISCGFAEVLFFCLSILFDMPVPLIAIQLLWLNVVTDGIQDFALSFERPEKNIMKEKPRSPKENLFNKELLGEILVSGTCIGLIVFALWYILINEANMELVKARTYIMALMIVIQNIHAFNCRSEIESSLTVSLKSNKIFLYGVLGSIILGILVLEMNFFNSFLSTCSLPFWSLIFLLILGSSIFVIMEIYKKIKRSKKI